MYPKKRNRLRVLALLLSFVLALCVLTGAALAEEPFPDTPEDPTTETAEQPPAEETPETEPGSEDALPSEPEPPEEPPMEGAYALDADVPGGWQNRPATIYVRVIDLNGTDWEKVEVILPGMSPFDVTQELLEYGCVERTMLENGTVLFFVTDRTGTVHELSLDVYCMDFSAPVLRAGINGTLLRVEAYDDLSGVAAIYVNDELYTTLDGGELNVRIDRLTDDAYLYIDALDNAGNWTDYVVLSNPFYEEAEPEPTPAPGTDTGKDQHDEHCPSDCDCRKEQTSTAQPSDNTGGNTGNSNNTAASGSGKNTAASSQPAQSASSDAAPVTKEDGTGFTQNGNSVTRDLLYDKYSNKQFITIETRNGETFYLVIDYDKPLDEDGERYETYFLNLVDEADLLALIDGDKTAPVCSCTTECEAGAVNTSCEVCKTNMTECTGKEKAAEKVPDTTPEPEIEPEPEKKSSGGAVALLLLLLLGGGFALYWFKFRKKKPDAKGPVDLDDYDYGEDEDDADYETEPDEPESTRDAEQEDVE